MAGSLRGLAIVALAYLAFSALVWMWSSVGIWRSAYWHRRRGGTPGWGIAARTLVVLSAVATLFRSGDLALQAAELGTLAAGRDSIGEIAEMKVSGDGSELVLRGNIAAGAADAVRDACSRRARRCAGVVLTSPGGRMLESGRMAALIRKRGLDTRVDDHCMSACTDLLLAGRDADGARAGQDRLPPARLPRHRTPMSCATPSSGPATDYLAAGVESRLRLARHGDAGAGHVVSDPGRAGRGQGADRLGHLRDRRRRRSGARPESLGEMRLRRQIAASAARINAQGPVRVDAGHHDGARVGVGHHPDPTLPVRNRRDSTSPAAGKRALAAALRRRDLLGRRTSALGGPRRRPLRLRPIAIRRESGSSTWRSPSARSLAGHALSPEEGRRHLLRHPQRPAGRLVEDRPGRPGPDPRLAVLADELDMAVEAGAPAAPRRPRSGRSRSRRAGRRADSRSRGGSRPRHRRRHAPDRATARQCAVAMSWIQRTQTALLTWPSSSMSAGAGGDLFS